MEKDNSQLSTLNSQLTSVAIVDDHKMIADSLARLLIDTGAVCITGTVYSAAECRELLNMKKPEVLLLDISLGGSNGIDLCVEIKKQYPQLKVLMLTSYSELASIRRALDAGADGYMLKTSTPEELLEGIIAVASGEQYLCDEVKTALHNCEKNPVELTPREKQLLQLIIEGYTLTQQADKMFLGVNTIRFYRQKLNFKLDAHNTAQLLQNAKAMGFA